MPESVRYLSLRGDTNTATEILIKFKRDARDVQTDLQLWTKSTHHQRGFLLLSAFKDGFGIRFAIPVVGLYVFEQLIGAMPILFYLRKIIMLTEEFNSKTTAILCITVFAMSIMMPTFFCAKNARINISLMWSTNLMAAILGVLGLYCHWKGVLGPKMTEQFHYVPLICLALFYCLYAIGPHRLTSDYAEKVIPKKCYFTMQCMLTVISWLLMYVITRMLPQLIDHIGVGYVFWFMAIMCVLMSVFVKLFVNDPIKVPEEFRLVDNSSSESNSEA